MRQSTALLVAALSVASAGRLARAEDGDFRFTLVPRLEASTADRGELPAADTDLSCNQPFFVEFWARDEGSKNSGVTCAYIDLLYDSGRLQVMSIVHAETFSEDPFASGQDDGAGLIDELGGCHLPRPDSPVSGIEPEWTCVARVQMMPRPADCSTTCSSASTTLTPSPAGEESSAYKRGKVKGDEITYESASPGLNCSCLYDLTGDCMTNAVDLGVMAPGWRKCLGDPDYDPRADFDCSGCFAGGDIGFLATAWLRDCSDPELVFAPCKGCEAGLLVSAQAGAAAPGVQFALRLAERHAEGEAALELPAGISAVRRGQRVYAEFWARDLDPQGSGLVAAFADLYFAPQGFRLVSTAVEPAYTLLASGEIQPGRVIALGGARVARDLGAPQWSRVATVELEAMQDTDAPRIWLRPALLDPAARYGAGAVSPEHIQVVTTIPLYAPGDFDRDGDVDQTDFGRLQRCLADELDSECEAADLSGDLTVNAADAVLFQGCLSGPTIPADISCGG